VVGFVADFFFFPGKYAPGPGTGLPKPGHAILFYLNREVQQANLVFELKPAGSTAGKNHLKSFSGYSSDGSSQAAAVIKRRNRVLIAVKTVPIWEKQGALFHDSR